MKLTAKQAASIMADLENMTREEALETLATVLDTLKNRVNFRGMSKAEKVQWAVMAMETVGHPEMAFKIRRAAVILAAEF